MLGDSQSERIRNRAQRIGGIRLSISDLSTDPGSLPQYLAGSSSLEFAAIRLPPLPRDAAYHLQTERSKQDYACAAGPTNVPSSAL